jgi:hypothetical protein
MDTSTCAAHTRTIALVVEQGVCSRPLVGVVVQPFAIGVTRTRIEQVMFIHVGEARKAAEQLV